MNLSRLRPKLETLLASENQSQNRYMRLIAMSDKQLSMDLSLLLSDPDSSPRVKRILDWLILKADDIEIL